MSDLHEPPFQQPNQPTPPRATCRQYRPGHTPDLVRVRLAQMSPPEDWRRAVILDVRNDVLTLGIGDELACYRSHDAAVVGVLIADHGRSAMFNVEYHLLFLSPRADGRSPIFSVQPEAEPTEPCSPDPTAR